jgi:hypothetical protein
LPHVLFPFLLQDEIVVEYDSRAMAPIGLVCMDLPDDCRVVLVEQAGAEVDAVGTGGRLFLLLVDM